MYDKNVLGIMLLCVKDEIISLKNVFLINKRSIKSFLKSNVADVTHAEDT